MANWTVATTLERLGEILQEEGVTSSDILHLNDEDEQVDLALVVAAMKDRIVRDQFTPKAKAQHRAKKTADSTPT